MAQNGGGTLVEASDRGAFQEGRAGEMDLFPEAAERRVGIQSGGGEFGGHAMLV